MIKFLKDQFKKDKLELNYNYIKLMWLLNFIIQFILIIGSFTIKYLGNTIKYSFDSFPTKLVVILSAIVFIVMIICIIIYFYKLSKIKEENTYQEKFKDYISAFFVRDTFFLTILAFGIVVFMKKGFFIFWIVSCISLIINFFLYPNKKAIVNRLKLTNTEITYF